MIKGLAILGVCVAYTCMLFFMASAFHTTIFMLRVAIGQKGADCLSALIYTPQTAELPQVPKVKFYHSIDKQG